MTRPAIAEEPVTRTLRDCAACACGHLKDCDAHITGGTHRHRESGCRPVIDSDEENARIINSGAYHPKAVL